MAATSHPDPPPAGGSFVIEAPAAPALTPEQLDEEARLMADAAADFMRGEVLPAADRLQEHEPGLMPALLRKAGALGLLGLEIPEAYGGLGLPKSAAARIAEAIAAEPSFAVSHNVHTSVAALPLVLFGTEEQKARYLPRLASGEWLGAYALSEAQAGSDALAARTRAVPQPDGGWLLSGEKMWITNAAFADVFIVFAQVESRGLTAFVVERGFPGVAIGREEHKLGLRGSSTCRLLLDDVPVPVANVIGAPGEGGKVALYTLNLGRFKIAASSLGRAKDLLGIATRYAKQRTAFGRPIAEFGLIQQKLATMAARIFACESMLYRVAGWLDEAFVRHEAGGTSHEPAAEFAIECALLKVACTETLDYCADECLQIHGGYGYTEEFPAARAWRDARVNRIYEGANEINRLAAVRLLLRRIEQARIELERGPALRDVEPLTTDALRAAFRRVLEIARDRLDDLPDEEEVCGALADMMTAILADESARYRAERLVEAGATEARWQGALDARALRLEESMAATQEDAAAILDLCGVPLAEEPRLAVTLSARPGDRSRRQRRLARAVIAAEGYIW